MVMPCFQNTCRDVCRPLSGSLKLSLRGFPAARAASGLLWPGNVHAAVGLLKKICRRRRVFENSRRHGPGIRPLDRGFETGSFHRGVEVCLHRLRLAPASFHGCRPCCRSFEIYRIASCLDFYRSIFWEQRTLNLVIVGFPLYFSFLFVLKNDACLHTLRPQNAIRHDKKKNKM
jgi:hypothetical protein